MLGNLPAASRNGDGSQNPGNNLHVSGLSHKVDTRDLEQAFTKVGRVRLLSRMRVIQNVHYYYRLRRPRSCMILIRVSRGDSGS